MELCHEKWKYTAERDRAALEGMKCVCVCVCVCVWESL